MIKFEREPLHGGPVSRFDHASTDPRADSRSIQFRRQGF